jgi:dipeptidyl aminopeptidase/acylaminoacyl peptidase
MTTGGLEGAQVVVQSIGGNDRRVVRDGASAARYLPTGHLVYAEGTALFALPFDPDAGVGRGGPVSILEGLRRSSNGLTDTANYAVSDTGTLITIPGDPDAGGQTGSRVALTWVDREGREEPLPVRAGDYTMARISPDGTKVALVVGAHLGRAQAPAIWIYDVRSESLRLLTADPEGDDGPVWSSDSRRIFFRSLRGDLEGVYAIDVDTSETTLIATSAELPFPYAITPDDRTLMVATAVGPDDNNIAALSIADGEFTPLLSDPSTSENQASISPNGVWLAYTEGAAPVDIDAEINIRPFPDVARTQFPIGRGQAPVFSRDGSELFFLDEVGLSAMPITYDPTLRVGPPNRLFEFDRYMRFAGRPWDVDPSGQRFLTMRMRDIGEGGQPWNRIDVVLNWFEELKRRVPVE